MEIERTQIIENGHVAAPVLHDFAENPEENFDDDDVETIWTHLDSCEECLDAYERLKDGGGKEGPAPKTGPPKAAAGGASDDAASVRPTLAPAGDEPTDPRGVSNPPPADPPKTVPDKPTAAAKPAQPKAKPAPPPSRSPGPWSGARYGEVLKRSLALIRTPKIAISGGAVLVAITLAVVLLSSSGEKPIVNPVEGWAPFDVIQSNVPLQEIPVRRLQNGPTTANAAANDVDLDFRGIKELVIAIDLDFIRESSKPYDLVVRNLAGQVVFQEAIPDLYINDGRLFLRLVPKQFDEQQQYTLELVERGPSPPADSGAEADANADTRVVAESVFRVVK